MSLQINLGLQQKLIFLVVPLPLGLRPSPLGPSSLSTWAYILLHLGLAKYACYHLLEGIHWLFGPTPSHRSLYLGSFRILIKSTTKALAPTKDLVRDLTPMAISPVQVVPKKGGMTVVKNDQNELIPTRTVTGWRMCIDYRKLNEATRKDHYPLPFMDQMLERLAGQSFYYFLDGYSGYNQIVVDPQDQEKIAFTCPFGVFAYRRMPFRLCNAPATF